MSDDKIKSLSSIILPSLPYADNALAPVISANTIGFHYSKHHRGYVDNLNKLVAGGVCGHAAGENNYRDSRQS